MPKVPQLSLQFHWANLPAAEVERVARFEALAHDWCIKLSAFDSSIDALARSGDGGRRGK